MRSLLGVNAVCLMSSSKEEIWTETGIYRGKQCGGNGEKTHGKAKTDAWNRLSQLPEEGVPACAMTVALWPQDPETGILCYLKFTACSGRSPSKQSTHREITCKTPASEDQSFKEVS